MSWLAANKLQAGTTFCQYSDPNGMGNKLIFLEVETMWSCMFYLLNALRINAWPHYSQEFCPGKLIKYQLNHS